VRELERGPRPRPASDTGPRPAAGADPRSVVNAIPFHALGGFSHHPAIPQMVPSILVPLSPGQRVLPWLAGGGILLLGTLIGWLLARV
jgi:hypothetical protein